MRELIRSGGEQLKDPPAYPTSVAATFLLGRINDIDEIKGLLLSFKSPIRASNGTNRCGLGSAVLQVQLVQLWRDERLSIRCSPNSNVTLEPEWIKKVGRCGAIRLGTK